MVFPVVTDGVPGAGLVEVSLLLSSGELVAEAVLGDFTGDLPQPDALLCFTVVTGLLGVTGLLVADSINLVSAEAVLLLVRSCSCSCCFLKVFLFLWSNKLILIHVHKIYTRNNEI